MNNVFCSTQSSGSEGNEGLFEYLPSEVSISFDLSNFFYLEEPEKDDGQPSLGILEREG